MFTTHTGRRYVLPTAGELRRQKLRASIRRGLECVAIAALLVSPLIADAFLH